MRAISLSCTVWPTTSSRPASPAPTGKPLDDLAPELAEFDLRCAVGEYDTAGWVLGEIDFNYLLLWGHVRLMAELHERLQGKLTDPRLKTTSLGNLGTCLLSLASGQVSESSNRPATN